MGVTIAKEHFDDDQIVDVVEIVVQTLFRDVWVDVADDEVSSRSYADLVGDVAW